jgi:hypothetical protein
MERIHGAVLGRSRTGSGARAALMAETLRPDFPARQITNAWEEPAPRRPIALDALQPPRGLEVLG